MDLLKAISLPAAAAFLVALVGLYFAKLEREEGQRKLDSLRSKPKAPDGAEDPGSDFPAHRPKPSPS